MIRIPDSKIEKAVAKDDVRTYLNAPYFTGEGIVATNGHTLAYVPVIHDDGELAGHIPLDAFKHARKAKLLDIELNNGNGNCAVAGVQFPRVDLGKYPDWQQVAKAPLVVAKSSGALSITFDAKLLLELALAISTNPRQPIVRLTFDASKPEYERAAIYVEAAKGGGGAYGLIMPCKFGD